MPSHVEESLMSTRSFFTPASSYKEMSRRARDTILSLSNDNLGEKEPTVLNVFPNTGGTHLTFGREALPGVHLRGDSAWDLLEDLHTEADEQLVHCVCDLLLLSPINRTDSVHTAE